jgi:hypothetical protein
VTFGRFWLAFAALVVLAVGAAGGKATPVKDEAAGKRVECTSKEVDRLVRAFIVAFNAGDRRRLVPAWSRTRFRVYAAMTPGRVFVTKERARLLRYFTRRHGNGERLTLESFRFNGNGAGYGHFEYELDRRARDLAGGKRVPYAGKGAADCIHMPRTLAVWSMGSRPADLAWIVSALRRERLPMEPAGREGPEFGLFGVAGRFYANPSGQVTIWEFASERAAKEAAASVSSDGHNVRRGNTVVHVDWIATPHWFRSDRVVAIYVGGDAATLAALRRVLGPQFAGR